MAQFNLIFNLPPVLPCHRSVERQSSRCRNNERLALPTRSKISQNTCNVSQTQTVKWKICFVIFKYLVKSRISVNSQLHHHHPKLLKDQLKPTLLRSCPWSQVSLAMLVTEWQYEMKVWDMPWSIITVFDTFFALSWTKTIMRPPQCSINFLENKQIDTK